MVSGHQGFKKHPYVQIRKHCAIGSLKTHPDQLIPEAKRRCRSLGVWLKPDTRRSTRAVPHPTPLVGAGSLSLASAHTKPPPIVPALPLSCPNASEMTSGSASQHFTQGISISLFLLPEDYISSLLCLQAPPTSSQRTARPFHVKLLNPTAPDNSIHSVQTWVSSAPSSPRQPTP